MSKQQNKITGNKGESLAAEYLQRKGYRVLERNYRSKWGEVDIICKYQTPIYTQPEYMRVQANLQTEEIVVFVEVKTKTTDKYGEPWEMISHWKIEQVKRMGEVWCREYAWEGRVRVDVVGVWLTGDEPKIQHWENVEI